MTARKAPIEADTTPRPAGRPKGSTTRHWGRPKGTPKTGGRKKGTPNKKTFSEMIEIFRDQTIDDVFNAWEKIKDPETKVKLWRDIIGIITPKPQPTAQEQEMTQDKYTDILKKYRKDGDASQ